MKKLDPRQVEHLERHCESLRRSLESALASQASAGRALRHKEEEITSAKWRLVADFDVDEKDTLEDMVNKASGKFLKQKHELVDLRERIKLLEYLQEGEDDDKRSMGEKAL